MSWGWPERAGDLKHGKPRTVAGKIADIMHRVNNLQLAVTVERKGIVNVEPAANAIPEEIIGVYDTERSKPDLIRQIAADLAAHVKSRSRGR